MGKRLSLLLVMETVTGILLVILGIASLQELATDSAFLHRYVLVPIQGINAALDDLTSLGDHPHDAHIVDRIDAFTKHYRDEIQVAGSSRLDARRQTGQLRRSGRLALIDQERLAIASLQQGVERLSAAANGTGVSQADLSGPRASLHELLHINLQFVDAAEEDLTASAARTRVVLVSVGLLGVVLAGVLAWRVRMAIAPRIEMLVRKIRRFHTDAPLDVAIKRAHAHVVTELRIRGPSLPPEDQIRMFDPFATIQYEGGTAVRSAMGLFLCRKIANLHGGSLMVDDKPGVGPVLILELPA